jgi:hypothetical protein
LKHIESIHFARKTKLSPASENDEIGNEEMQMLRKVLNWIYENKSHFKALRNVLITDPYHSKTRTIEVDKIPDALQKEGGVIYNQDSAVSDYLGYYKYS